jgi:hypothetical protein
MVFLACYIVCIIMIRDVPLVYPIRKMLAAGVGCLLFGIGTVFFFKSSMHLTAMGAAVAYLGVAVSSGIAMLPLLYGAIALTALLASARLYSGVEDVRQSAVGFAGGLVVTFLVVFLI